ncbi:AMP-binding protein [Actinomadura roseirufa]|uniref:AMP-binding protein n=1 Tax=Actinomadura roseirufa TaxID=2094049 RepID=UPI001040F1A7|nr:AMP-binding protein [Actinomadura roseirufa]
MSHINKSEWAAETLVDLLRRRSADSPDDLLCAFLSGGVEVAEQASCADLDRSARACAVHLERRGLTGSNIVLAYPYGLDFVNAFAGCLYAGVAAAPVKMPQAQHDLERVRRIADAAGTRVVLTTGPALRELRGRFPDAEELRDLILVETDDIALELADEWIPPDLDAGHTALLQFTSGSTGHPKGVMVSHRNLITEAELIDRTWPMHDDGVVASWAPFHHDLGLVYSVILPWVLGVPAYLLSPALFVRRPRRLLEAISRFRATHTCGPNFGFELCLRDTAPGLDRLDLSGLRVALNGAEVVREHTVRRFAEKFKPAGFDPRAMCAAYGMAESTLAVCGSRDDEHPKARWLSATALRNGEVVPVGQDGPDAVPIMSCGSPMAGVDVRVVDPATMRELADDEIGELWVRGPCVALGYWNRPDATRETFQGRIAGQEGDGEFLRTGDLAFRYDGELYVAGRLKDLIIVEGQNYHPEDIESVVEDCDPSLSTVSCAAFAVDRDGAEQAAVVVEISAGTLAASTADRFAERVRDVVWDRRRLPVAEVAVVRRGSLAKTSSGKIQRAENRRLLETGALDGQILAHLRGKRQEPVWSAPDGRPVTSAGLVRPMVRLTLSRILGVPAEQIADDRPFAHYGLTSGDAIRLASAVEAVMGRPIDVALVFNHPTVEGLTQALGRSEETV